MSRTTPDKFLYVGNELDLFLHARHWKAYWISHVRSWIRGDVLEVGAGIGANTVQLQNPEVRSWCCVEPDPRLVIQLEAATRDVKPCTIRCGTLEALSGRSFDCIVYIDVLEHIEDDRSEMARAAQLLRPGGHIVVLSPAHQFLYSPFDAAIGHYRRYDKNTLRACTPAECKVDVLQYVDSCGIMTSLANRALLRQANPTLKQILFWDRHVVPVSRIMDPLLGFRLGKSIVGVWTRR